jgi:CheY-like chemotaxis protein
MTIPKASVLIVDDEPILAGVLEEWLGSWGFQCTSAGCVSDAVAAFEKLRMTEGPKIILLDWLIPQGRKDLERALSLDARKSELQNRLSSLIVEKREAGEVNELRRKLNDLDGEIERMLLAERSGEFLDIVEDQLDGVGVIFVSGNTSLIRVPTGIKSVWVIARPFDQRRLRDTLRECCERLAESSGRLLD